MYQAKEGEEKTSATTMSPFGLIIRRKDGKIKEYKMLSKKDFAERLKSAIKENGITQAKLAEMIDTSTASISNYTKGKAFPPLDTLVELSNALGKSIDWLCYKKEDGTKVAHLETVGDAIRVWEQLHAIPYGVELQHYFYDSKRLKELVAAGNIGQDFYDRWHASRLRDLDKIPIKPEERKEKNGKTAGNTKRGGGYAEHQRGHTGRAETD